MDDLAAAVLFVMQLSDERYAAACASGAEPAVSHLNVGCGEDIRVAELAKRIRGIVGFAGEVAWDPGRPDGMPRKLLDVSRLSRLGWRLQITLDAGVRSVYEWYLSSTGVFGEKGIEE